MAQKRLEWRKVLCDLSNRTSWLGAFVVLTVVYYSRNSAFAQQMQYLVKRVCRMPDLR